MHPSSDFPPRRALPAILALLGACAPSAADTAAVAETAAAADRAEAVVLVDVNVIPMDRERILEGRTVVVRDGRIVRIGPSSEVDTPAGARVVRGGGGYLVPGLAEMHAHIPPPQAGEEVIERTLFLYLAGGVTTIRGMLGHPRHLELREQAARDRILSPRIFTSGPSFNGTSATGPEAARRMVAEQKAAGYDFLKLHPGLSRETFDAIDEAADRLGIPFSGHVSADVGLRRALDARYATIDHLDGYLEALAGRDTWRADESGFFGLGLVGRLDEARVAGLAEATRAAGVWNVPTQSLMEHLASPEAPEEMARWPEMRYMPAATVADWVARKRGMGITPEQGRRYLEARRAMIRALQEAGAGLLLGSDAPQVWNVPGFSVHRELAFLVDAGLTPYQALRTGTYNPAAFFDGLDDWGTVEEGRSADLVLLEADPLQDIHNSRKIAGVMVRGRWIPREEIAERLDSIAAAVSGR